MTTAIASVARREALASWENEGGATGTTASGARPTEERRVEIENDLADKHTLTIMRISLVLVAPLLAGIAIFWASLGFSK